MRLLEKFHPSLLSYKPTYHLYIFGRLFRNVWLNISWIPICLLLILLDFVDKEEIHSEMIGKPTRGNDDVKFPWNTMRPKRNAKISVIEEVLISLFTISENWGETFILWRRTLNVFYGCESGVLVFECLVVDLKLR